MNDPVNLGFHLGSAVKYLWRFGQKNAPLEDLKKAKWYVERLDTNNCLHLRQVTEAIDKLTEENKCT
jgi:hypothetical protein